MFPWVCLKCGGMFENSSRLVGHIKDEKHDLSTDELRQFVAAMDDVHRAVVGFK
jgi:hypothetical protein